MIELVASICALLAVCVIVAGAVITSREQRKLFRSIRKMAALYPPYPLDTDMGEGQRTSVHLQEQWNDDLEGRN